ncbi:MAG TPA: M1 family metallopeptidase [Gemmatimonadaceae bacterium]|nr:M1 family metallopeptidase [Gemmatimonadaceae bacterium]
MIARLCLAVVVLVGSACPALVRAQITSQASYPAQGSRAMPLPERAVRRDIPLTDMIRRAFASGTRDSTGRPGRNYWQLWTDYKITARLDSATRVVSGRETVTIRNNSDSAMKAVVLRLDQNVFRADAVRISAVTDITEGMRVSRLVINGQTFNVADTVGAPIPGSTRRTTPLARALTETSARITLANPIAPHSSAVLEADWSFRVPSVSARERGYRMGRWADSLYQVAQWYPRVAVYDDLRAGGWDTEPYLGDAEFYNNFGHWDVSLDVPGGWLVSATGVLQNPNDVLTPTARTRLSHVLESDSTLTIVSAAERGPGKSTAPGNRAVWRFVADTAGDFAWGTSNQYVWTATRANIPGKGFVPINMFFLPGHAVGYAQVGPRTRHALEYYSKLWMPYAFPQLTVVDGPETGMEYPMFIMSALGAADHEAGHQWWPMMVGVNETWYGFMDEGFNEYMNVLSDADREGKPADLDSLGMSYARVSGNENEAPLMWNENYGGTMYSYAAYEKTPRMLSALGGVVGDTAVQRAMSEYAKAWRFKHPSPWDYAFFMNNALHRDLGWFWNYWLFTTESVDESIQSVVTQGNTTRVTVRQDGQMPAPVILRVEFAPGSEPIRAPQNATMESPTAAVVTYPVDVWFAGSKTFTALLDFGPRKINRITLDPHNRFPDHNQPDNVWPRTSPAPAK